MTGPVATAEGAITCPKCGGPNGGRDGEPGECATCRSPMEVRLFRSMWAPPEEGGGEEARAVFEGGGATCFFCEGQVATATCGGCGRFICERCKVDWAGELTCLTCIHAKRELKDDDRFKSRRTIYDNLALSLLLLPLLLPVYGIFISVMMAPVSLFLVIRHWNSSRGIVPRGRARQIWAVVLSSLVLLGVVLGIGVLFLSN